MHTANLAVVPPRLPRPSEITGSTPVEEKKERYLKALSSGQGMAYARDMAGGVADSTVRRWRLEDPAFRSSEAALKGDGNHSHMTAAESLAHVGLDDLEPFIRFRKDCFEYDTYRHHREIATALFGALDRGNREITMVLAPPESAKTALVSEDVPSYLLAYYPNMRIAVVSEGMYHAKKVIGSIKRRMMDTGSRYVIDHGPFHVPGMERRGKEWSAEALRIWKADGGERDFSVEAKGWTGQIVGSRKDLIILDDVMSLRNLNQSAEVVRRWRQDIMSRLNQNGACFIVGTRVGPGDFYESLIDAGLVDHLIKIEALDVDGHSYCPEMWPDDALERTRHLVGEEAWWRNYMQQPKSVGNASFSPTSVEASKRHLDTSSVPPGASVVLGLDPAIGGYCALLACRWEMEGLTAVELMMEKDLGQVEPMLQMVRELAVRYHPSHLIVETDTMQKGLARDERLLAMAEQLGFQVLEHRTSGEKADPVLGVASMAGSFQRGEIGIAWGDDYSRRKLEPLCAQLLAWRPSIDELGRYKRSYIRQDAVMALWFIWRWWMVARHYSADQSGIRGKGLPWSPTAWNRAAKPERRREGVA